MQLVVPAAIQSSYKGEQRAWLLSLADFVRAVMANEAPPKYALRQRRPGTLKGKIWTAPDFDELPPDVLDAFEGE